MGTDTMRRGCAYPGGMAALFCGTAERRWPRGFTAALPHRLGCAFQRRRNTRYRYAGRKIAGINTSCCVFPLFISAVLYEMLSL